MSEELKREDIDGISLIGFRIDPDSDEPDLYTLCTYGAKDIPLTINDQVLFFRSPNLINIAYKYFNEYIKNISPLSSISDTPIVFDIAMMLHIMNHKDIDDSVIIVHCLNMIFDLVKATKIDMPKKYKYILYKFADHLTFDKEFATYLSTKKITRKNITDATLWCIGAITIKSKMISNNNVNIGV